jgi:hypothetical protein
MGYSLHVHTAGGAYCWSWKDTLQVNTVGGGRVYTLHVLTLGGEKGRGYKFILLAVEGGTPWASILLAVQQETPCTSILLVLKGGYSLHILPSNVYVQISLFTIIANTSFPGTFMYSSLLLRL